MRRLNDTELDARIHKFLHRKFKEFPELNQSKTQPDGAVSDRQPKTKGYHAGAYLGAGTFVV